MDNCTSVFIYSATILMNNLINYCSELRTYRRHSFFPSVLPFPRAIIVTPATPGERWSFSDRKLRGGTKKSSTYNDIVSHIPCSGQLAPTVVASNEMRYINHRASTMYPNGYKMQITLHVGYAHDLRPTWALARLQSTKPR